MVATDAFGNRTSVFTVFVFLLQVKLQLQLAALHKLAVIDSFASLKIALRYIRHRRRLAIRLRILFFFLLGRVAVVVMAANRCAILCAACSISVRSLSRTVCAVHRTADEIIVCSIVF